MKTITREWDWWAYHFRVTHRQTINGIAEWDDRLVEFIVETMDLKPGIHLLDVACGSGVHLLRLARLGMKGWGIDIAPSLVRYAGEQALKAGVAERLKFSVGDMRRLSDTVGREAFDAVTLLSGSFGFFDNRTNQQVLEGMAACLRPGGRLLMDCVAPVVTAMPRSRSWSELDGGIQLDESWFDPVTCTRIDEFRYLDRDGVMNLSAEPERIRIYTLPELDRMVRKAGMEVIGAYAGYTIPPVPYAADHANRLIILAEARPAEILQSRHPGS